MISAAPLNIRSATHATRDRDGGILQRSCQPCALTVNFHNEQNFPCISRVSKLILLRPDMHDAPLSAPRAATRNSTSSDQKVPVSRQNLPGGAKRPDPRFEIA